MTEPENRHDKSDVEDNRKEGGTAAERVFQNRDYKGRSLLAYLRSEDFEVDVDADGQILVVPEAKLESMPDLQDAVRDLAPELLHVVQKEIARLLVETWYPCPAAGPSYAARPTVDEVLASVREYWPDDAVYVRATYAGAALFRAAWTAARELECHTGDKTARRFAGEMGMDDLTADDDEVQRLVDRVFKGWERAGIDNPPDRPALEKLRRFRTEKRAPVTDDNNIDGAIWAHLQDFEGHPHWWVRENVGKFHEKKELRAMREVLEAGPDEYLSRMAGPSSKEGVAKPAGGYRWLNKGFVRDKWPVLLDMVTETLERKM